MNAAILLICVLVPVLAASMFYLSDRRAARYTVGASSAASGGYLPESDPDTVTGGVGDSLDEPDR